MSTSAQRLPFHDCNLHVPPNDFQPLPWLPTIARGFHRAWTCRRAIRAVEERADVVIVQLPFAAPLALLRAKRPRLYHVCANIRAMARLSNAYEGARRLPAVAVGNAFDHIQRRLIRSSSARVVTNGSELWEHYGRPPGRAVVSTSILASEIQSVRRTRPADAPFRVLYVGYMRKAKGIDTLLDAFDAFVRKVPHSELVLVGPADAADHGMAELLARRIAEPHWAGKVQRLPHVPFGPELFQCYADADVLALPSRSEGTPRVLVEARAFGCPVIGTRVGGIPNSITDGEDGLMVPANDSSALAAAVERVATDGALRQRLIEGGLRRARASSVESFVQVLAEEIEALMANTPPAH